MKLPFLASLCALAALFTLSGCAQLDLTPPGDPNRVLTGTISASGPLPAGTEIVVRLLDTAMRDVAPAISHDAVAPASSPLPAPERVVQEQTQTLPGAIEGPVPFRVEYQAEDALLRRGLTIDVRVSFDGRVRYRTVSSYIVTLATAANPHSIQVQPVR